MVHSNSLFTVDLNLDIVQSLAILIVASILCSLSFSKLFRPYTSPLNRLKGPSFGHWYYGSYDLKILKQHKIHQQLVKWKEEYKSKVFAGKQAGRLNFVYVQDRKAASYIFLSKSAVFQKPSSS